FRRQRVTRIGATVEGGPVGAGQAIRAGNGAGVGGAGDALGKSGLAMRGISAAGQALGAVGGLVTAGSLGGGREAELVAAGERARTGEGPAVHLTGRVLDGIGDAAALRT